MATTPYDLIVIGGGPAGYVGAIRASQLGKRVAVVEKERAGGTCLNWGCIPTKALLKNAEVYTTIAHHAEDFGLSVDGLKYDWDKVIGRSRKVADKLAGGIEFLFKKNKVDYIKGDASVPKAGTVEVKAADGSEQTLQGAKILISTGVVTREMPGFPFNGTSVIGSRHALVLAKQPKELIVIGAGAIGVEFAYFFNSFGTKVTIVEMQPNILPVEDTEVSAALEKALIKQGIRILTGTKVEKATATKDGVKITVSGGANETLSADVALVAIGVSPLLPGGAAPFKLDERGYLAVDDKYETSIPGVYAAGDIIGPPWLAHVASFEAVQAVEGMFGKRKPARRRTFPGCTYCQPQVASVGLTERAAKEKGLKVKIGKFPFQASGKALAVGESDGFVKLLFNEPHGEIVGAHIIGADATEMIAELGLAITLEATYDDIAATIHAHPTLSEAVFEATEAAQGHAIHI
ncbi:MAG: dihydrolipoyl dehydrogenase [Proteobacteria bacterium]|jgi:dihydrolipoamide dehydrogenase|nr:dihydrolipoyl dehydrogenase [Pseudomonadota bacterium]